MNALRPLTFHSTLPPRHPKAVPAAISAARLCPPSSPPRGGERVGVRIASVPALRRSERTQCAREPAWADQPLA